MSRVPFLDNARSGENNLLRYIFTVLLTWGTPIVLQIIIILYAMSYFLSHGNNMENLLTLITTDPMVLIALVGVTSVVSIIFLYIGVRYIHHRKFISLVSTDSTFSWKKLLKGPLA